MRIFYLILGSLMAVSLTVLAGATGDSVVEDSSGGGSTSLSSDPTPTFSADADLVTYDLKRGDDWYKVPVATDAAPNPTTFVGQSSVVSAATVVTNQTGANEVHQPGTGLRQLEIKNAAGVATVTLQSQTDGALNTARTLVIGTICSAGGLTAAQCACLVYDALVGTPAVGIATPTRLDGTCSNARLAFAVTPGVASTLTIATTDAAVAAVVSGADGRVVMPIGNGLPSTPDITFVNDTDTGFYRRAANQMGVSAGGVEVGIFAATGYEVYAPLYFKPTKGAITAAVNGQFVAATYGGAAGGWFVYPQTITCATSGDGNPSTCGGAQTINSNIVATVCNDADGCTLTLAETNYSATVSGCVTIFGPAANTLTLADSAGVVELVGGTSWAPSASTLANIELCYSPIALAWVEKSRAAP